MLKKLGGFGFLLMLLSLPLHAEHRHRSGHYPAGWSSPGFVQFQVVTPYGGGVFVRDYRPAPRYYYQGRRDYRDRGRYDRYDRYDRYEREDRRHRRWHKRHHHFHHRGRCPY